MLAVKLSTGTWELSELQVDAVRRFAGRQAELTATMLSALDVFRSSPPALPAAFLLELAAVLQIGVWERQGFAADLADAGLPTFVQAAQDLGRRAVKGPAEFEAGVMPAVTLHVLQTWMERFAWESQEHFGCDLVLSDMDEDAFADAMARFLWEHRHELDELLAKGDL